MVKKIKSGGASVLVTGGGGYIGAILVEELVSKGYSVKVLDSLLWGERPLAKFKDKIEVIQMDIRNVTPDVLQGVTAVIHQAGFSNDPMANYNPEANFEVNTTATINFAKLCKKQGVKRFTLASSASIYDRGFLATDDVMQTEESDVEPKAAYSLSKFEAEKGLISLADNDFCPVILRQGTVYGFSPRMRYDLVVNAMVKTALEKNKITVFCGGEQWRPLVDVRDVALAHIAAIEAEHSQVCGETFNVMYKNYRILELAHWVQKVLRKELQLNPEIEVDYSPRQDRSYRISGEKITKVMGWTPTTSVEDSIKHMVKQIQAYGYADFSHPRYFNIEWMKMLCDVQEILKKSGKIF